MTEAVMVIVVVENHLKCRLKSLKTTLLVPVMIAQCHLAPNLIVLVILIILENLITQMVQKIPQAVVIQNRLIMFQKVRMVQTVQKCLMILMDLVIPMLPTVQVLQAARLLTKRMMNLEMVQAAGPQMMKLMMN